MVLQKRPNPNVPHNLAGTFARQIAMKRLKPRQQRINLAPVTAAEFVVVAVDDHRMPRTLPVAA
jgi:hypothetical protein